VQHTLSVVQLELEFERLLRGRQKIEPLVDALLALVVHVADEPVRHMLYLCLAIAGHVPAHCLHAALVSILETIRERRHRHALHTIR
jgi:hypothetical protein